MKHNHSNNTELEQAKHVAKHVVRVSHDIKLSKQQKKAMLSEIFPKKPIYLRLAPMLSTATFALLIVGVIFVQGSQPGDALYSLKRSIEDVRSSVQPSYDQQLIKRREDEIKQIEDNGGSEQKVEIANQEKQKIKERVKERSGESEDQRKSSESGSNSEQNQSEHSSGDTEVKSAKDQCESDLDSRKKAGEQITSEAYKACDKL